MSPETLQVVPDRIWRGICDLEISNATSLFTSYQIKVRQNKYQLMHVRMLDNHEMYGFQLSVNVSARDQGPGPDSGEAGLVPALTLERLRQLLLLQSNDRRARRR